MAIVTDIAVDSTDLVIVRDGLWQIPKRIPFAIASAINDTGGGRSGGRRGLRQMTATRLYGTINMTKGRIQRSVMWRRAQAPSLLHGRLFISGRHPISLKHFGAMQNARGVSYKIIRGGQRQTLMHAFIPKKGGKPLLGGNVFLRIGVFRKMGHGRYKGLSREVIEKQTGPSLAGVFNESGLMEPTVVDARQLLRDNLRDRVRFELLRFEGRLANQGRSRRSGYSGGH